MSVPSNRRAAVSVERFLSLTQQQQLQRQKKKKKSNRKTRMKPAEIPLMAKSLLKLLVTAFRELHKQELFRMKTDNGTLGKIRFS